MTELAGEAFRGAARGEDVAKLLAALRHRRAATAASRKACSTRSRASWRIRNSSIGSRRRRRARSPAQSYALTSLELASRLSFFLWSTIPDAELREIAAADGLEDPAAVEKQVRRLLADPRSETLATNFAYQWLGLGKLASLAPDPEVFGDVDRNIREHFATETQLFVDSVFREDRNVLGPAHFETHVSERSARVALWPERRPRQTLPPSGAGGRGARGPARQRRACCSSRRIRIALRRCCGANGC